jgi:hypothetical protein
MAGASLTHTVCVCTVHHVKLKISKLTRSNDHRLSTYQHCRQWFVITLRLNSVAFSPQANYTDRATAACRWSLCQLLRIEGVAWSAQRIPTAVNIGFLDRNHYFSIQIAPQLSSRGWVNPVPDPLFLRKSGSTGNETQDLWICSQELWPLDHRGGQPSQADCFFCNWSIH